MAARLPDPVFDALDAAARQLRRSRADVTHLEIEHYLQQFDDLSVAIDRLRDPVLDWEKVRHEFLDADLGERRQSCNFGVLIFDLHCFYSFFH